MYLVCDKICIVLRCWKSSTKISGSGSSSKRLGSRRCGASRTSGERLQLFQVDYHEQLVENYLWININHFCNIHDWNGLIFIVWIIVTRTSIAINDHPMKQPVIHQASSPAPIAVVENRLRPWWLWSSQACGKPTEMGRFRRVL